MGATLIVALIEILDCNTNCSLFVIKHLLLTIYLWGYNMNHVRER